MSNDSELDPIFNEMSEYLDGERRQVVRVFDNGFDKDRVVDAFQTLISLINDRFRDHNRNVQKLETLYADVQTLKHNLGAFKKSDFDGLKKHVEEIDRDLEALKAKFKTLSQRTLHRVGKGNLRKEDVDVTRFGQLTNDGEISHNLGETTSDLEKLKTRVHQRVGNNGEAGALGDNVNENAANIEKHKRQINDLNHHLAHYAGVIETHHPEARR